MLHNQLNTQVCNTPSNILFDPREECFRTLRKIQKITSGKTCFIRESLNITSISTEGSNIIEASHIFKNATDSFDFKDEIKNILISYLSYPAGWDGDKGLPPSREMVSDVLCFLDEMINDMNLPKPMLAIDGEISLHWGNAKAHLDVVFVGNGTYSYFAKDKQGNKYYIDDKSIDQIATQFYEILSRI